MGRLTEELALGDVRAQCVKYSLGGDVVFVITSDHEESEVVLNIDEAKALQGWLGKAINAFERGEPLTWDTFWQRVRETNWNPTPPELAQMLMKHEASEHGPLTDCDMDEDETR